MIEDWTNRETWALATNLVNDGQKFPMMKRKAEAAWGDQSSANSLAEKSRQAEVELAHVIENYFLNESLVEERSFAVDLIIAALARVNFREVAAHVLELSVDGFVNHKKLIDEALECINNCQLDFVEGVKYLVKLAEEQEADLAILINGVIEGM